MIMLRMSITLNELNKNNDRMLKYIETIDDPIIKLTLEEGWTYLQKHTTNGNIPSNTTHEFVLMKDPYNNTDVQIDKNIAPLIKRLWKLNIYTLLSCEDNVPANYIWICMSIEDADLFLSCMCKHNKNKNFTWRMNNDWIFNAHYEYDFYSKRCSNNDVNIRFPKDDYKIICRLLDKAISQPKK